MSRFGIELAVVGVTVLMTIGFIITYIVAVNEDHVTPDFPYISDTGGKVPESCVFSFVCSLGVILMLVIIYVRYKHINQHFTDSVAKIQWLNTITFGIGLLSMLGLLLVGSFQNDSVEQVHFIGAFMVFGFGVVYCWLQTLLSYKLYKLNYRHGGVAIIIIRLILSISMVLFFVMTVVTGDLAFRKYDGDPNAKGTFIWTAQDAGFGLHVTSTATEWLLGGSFLLYFLTFHVDFTRIRPDVIIRVRYHHSDMTMVNTINENSPLI